MTDARLLIAARTWLEQNGADPVCVNRYTDFRVMNAVAFGYTGGWAAFEHDTMTVINASEWELSW